MVRLAMNRYRADVAATPDILPSVHGALKHLRKADENLEGTDIVRLFAAFEAALRSYDRFRREDSTRLVDASTLIDQVGGKAGRGIHATVRRRAHEVRRVRNYWAHESDENPGAMTIDQARARLQIYLSELPDEWG